MKTNEEILNEYLEKTSDVSLSPKTKEVVLQAMNESNKHIVTILNELMVFLLQHPEKEFFKPSEIPMSKSSLHAVGWLYFYLGIEDIKDNPKAMILTGSYVAEKRENRTIYEMLYGLNLKR